MSHFKNINIGVKICFKCFDTLPLCVFTKFDKMIDGYTNECIKCSKMSKKLDYKKNKRIFSGYNNEKKSIIKKLLG